MKSDVRMRCAQRFVDSVAKWWLQRDLPSVGCFSAFAGCLIIASCSRTPLPAPDTLALVNGRPVTEASFRHWWTNQPPAAGTTEARQVLLDRLIERSALAQASREAGLDQDAVVIEHLENLLIARLKETRLEPQLRALTIPEEELRATYEADAAARYSQPECTRVAVLWFNTRGQAPLVARYQPRLDSIRERLISGEDAPPPEQGFGPLALGNSEHRTSRYKGGDLGWLEAGGTDAWRKTVLDLAASLHQPGEVGEVFADDQGLFLVRLIERRPAHVRSFETVRAGLERRLLAERRRALEEEFNAAIRQQARVETFTNRLTALEGLAGNEPPDAGGSPLQFTSR